MARITDRIAALEKLLLAQAKSELVLTFTVPMTLAYLDDPEGETAKARAAAIASGINLAPDARAVPIFDDEAASEAYCMAQQARLIADGQADVQRAIDRHAAVKAAELVAKAPPQRKHKPPPVFTPSVFAPSPT